MTHGTVGSEDTPSTVVFCVVKQKITVRNNSFIQTVSFICADGEFTASDMHALCCSISVVQNGYEKTTDSTADDINRVDVELLFESNDIQQELCHNAFSFKSIETVEVYGVVVNTNGIKNLRPYCCEPAVSKIKSVLDYYCISRPLGTISFDSSDAAVMNANITARSLCIASRSVSLLAVMRLVGGPGNMATLVTLLLSGR